MKNNKPDIKEELNHIRDSINKKKDEKEKVNEDDDYILLDKIVVKSNKEISKISNNRESKKKDTSVINKKTLENDQKKPVFKDFRQGDVKDSLANVDKAASELGYEASHDLKQGLEQTFEWFYANKFQV